MDDRRAPIEPGPEPDTTDAAEPDDTDARIDREDEPEMIDRNAEDVDKPLI